MIIDNPIVSGSLNVQNNVTASNGLFTGDVTVLGSINATVQGTTATASYVALGNVDGFTDVSSSISSRLSAQENFSSSLNSTFATDAELSAVSGALASSISSISTDFADITNKPTLISSSAQIASDISGSFASTSSSLAQRVSTNETNIASLTSVTSSYLQNTTDTLTGDLTVTGKITAQEFHTEFVSASIIYESGSTKFGDSLDDIHTITGSVNITGSLNINGAEVGTGKLNETVFNSYTSSTNQRLDIAEGSISSLNDATSSYALVTNISGAFASNSSSLAQRVSAQEAFSSSLDATFATDQQVNDAVSLLNAATSSYALEANISGAFASTSSSFSQRIASQEAFSSSLDATFATDAQVTAAVSDLNAATSSYALQSDISGAFASTSSSLAQRVSAQEDFSSSLNATFATDAELSAVSGALALSISSISTDFADITNKPTLISSSAQIASDISGSSTALSSSLSTRIASQESFSSSLSTTELILSGSFSGSFYGDGSNLSGVTSYTDADTLAFINSRAVLSGSIAELTSVTASFLNTGSVTIPHSFNSKNVSVSVYDSNDILIIPQEIALISNSAVKLTFGGSTSGFAVVSKGGHIVSGSVPVPQLSTVTSAFTSATTHTVTHNFNTKEVIVSVYENDSLIIPDTVTTDDVNNVTVTFPEAISGRVVIVKAGHIVSGSIPFDNLLDSPFVQSATAVTASKHIVPSLDQTYDLGSPNLRFRDLYLSSASIFLGNTVISENNVVTTSSLQSVLPAGTLSGSAQIASDISGSFISVSASIASDLVSNYLRNTTDTLTGNLTVTGTLTAQEFHTEFVSASILYDSGSTQFGNSADDTHIFTGNVGIGTTSIASTLHVKTSTDSTLDQGLVIERSVNSDRGYISYQGGGFQFRATDGDPLVFGQVSDQRMRIGSDGKVGIGTTSPLDLLHIKSSTTDARFLLDGHTGFDAEIKFAENGEVKYTAGYDAASTSFVIGTDNVDTNRRLVINSSGNIGIGESSPDTKLHVVQSGAGEQVVSIFENSTNADETKASIQLRNATNDVCSVKILGHRTGANFGSDLAFELSDNVDGSFQERMRITETGNVGIGTSTASDLLHLRNTGTDNPSLLLLEGAQINRGLQISLTTDSNGAVGAAAVYNARTAGGYGGHIFQNGGSTKMVINSSGKVGIGTTSPSISPAVNAGLHVNNNNYIQLRLSSTVNSAGMEFIPYNSGNQHNYEIQATANGDWFIYDRTDNAYRFNIEPSGDVAIGNNSSNFTSSGRRVLEINGTSEALLSFAHNGSWQYYINALSSGIYHATGNKNLLLEVGSGNVGIGTTSPGTKLNVRVAAGGGDSFKIDTAAGNTIVLGGVGSSLTYLRSYETSFEVGNSFSGGDLRLKAGNQERIRIISDGNVGIGTTSPNYPLHLVNSGVYHITVEQSKTDTNDTSAYATYYIKNNAANSTLNGYFGAGGNNVGNTAMRNHIYFGAQSNHGVRFFTNDTAKMTITSGGLVGINTTAPTYVLQSESGGVASYFKGGNGGYAAVGFSGDNNSTIGVLTTWNSGIYFGRSNGSFGSAFGANSDIFIKGSDGNVGINTTSPTAKLDINGSVRYRGSIYDETTFNASGNYSSGTYYTMVTASTIAEGVYIITGYVDTYNSGGGIYFMKFATVPFYLWHSGSNSTTYTDIPEPIGTGHHKGANLPLFRLQHQLGASGGNVFLQFNPNANWTGMDGTVGKTFFINLKRLSGV